MKNPRPNVNLPPTGGYKVSKLGKQGSKPDLQSQNMASPARSRFGGVPSPSGASGGSQGRSGSKNS